MGSHLRYQDKACVVVWKKIPAPRDCCLGALFWQSHRSSMGPPGALYGSSWVLIFSVIFIVGHWSLVMGHWYGVRMSDDVINIWPRPPELLVSVSSDGNVLQWSLKKGLVALFIQPTYAGLPQTLIFHAWQNAAD